MGLTIGQVNVDGKVTVGVPRRRQPVRSARLLQSPELRDRLGLRARHHVIENFSWKRVAERFTALFQEVIDRTQASPKQT